MGVVLGEWASSGPSGRPRGLVLANAVHIAKVPGRKTDVQDCVWLAQLLEHGLLRGSFVPPLPIRELRDLTRYRESVIEERTRETSRVVAENTEGGAMTMDRPKPSKSNEVWASGDTASGWKRGAAARGRALDPLTELMLDLAGVTVGSKVLDLGAGTGDQTVLAARRIGPEGMVLATDISASMLALTQEAARAADLPNVQTRVMDAQRLELESGSFDAAMARFSLQFVPDVQRALAEVRRVVKPGGRFSAVVFSAVERNPFRAAPQAIASRLAGKQFPESGPGQWALNDPTTLRSAFRLAGFRDVDVRPVPFVYRFPSLADAVRNLKEAQPPLVKLLDELSDDDQATAWAEINQTLQPLVGPDGFAAPSEALIVVGVA